MRRLWRPSMVGRWGRSARIYWAVNKFLPFRAESPLWYKGRGSSTTIDFNFQTFRLHRCVPASPQLHLVAMHLISRCFQHYAVARRPTTMPNEAEDDPPSVDVATKENGRRGDRPACDRKSQVAYEKWVQRKEKLGRLGFWNEW